MINAKTTVCNFKEYIDEKRHRCEDHDKHEYEQTDLCCICVDEFEDADSIRVTVCDHTFHDECLVKWLEHKISKSEEPDCPECRCSLGEAKNSPKAANLQE